MFNSKTLNYFIKIFSFLPKSRRKEFLALIPVALISGFSEVFVLAIVSRLFNFLSDQPRDAVPFLSDLFDLEPKYKILILISGFIFFSWFSSFLKLYVRAKQLKLKATIWRDLSELALKNLLSQEYEFFIENKNTDISASILVSINRVAENIVLPILKTVSGIFLILLISIAILVIAKINALILILGLLLSFLLISLSIIPYIRYATKKRLEVELVSNNIINESLNSIIDIKLTNSEYNFGDQEIKLFKKISEWPKCVEVSTEKLEPHRISVYLYELASDFHSYWNMGKDDVSKRFIEEDNSIKEEKLVFLKSIANTIKSGMDIIGVDTPKKM